jgi:hypothetical protein
MSEASPGERPCECKCQGHRGRVVQALRTSQYHVPWMPDMELQDLIFALLGFSIVCSSYDCIPLFWNGNVYSVLLYLGIT